MKTARAISTGAIVALTLSVGFVHAQANKSNVTILATGRTIVGAAKSGTQAGYTSGAATIDAMVAAGPAMHVPVQEPKATTREAVVGTARVDSIDAFSRAVTLRTDDNQTQTVYVGPELKIFDELKKGDRVTVRLIESVVVAARRNATPTVVEDTTAAAKKQLGESRDVQQQLKAIVTVDNVDSSKQLITYHAANNVSVTRVVADPRLLEGLKRGDVIEVTYTRSRAIAIDKQR